MLVVGNTLHLVVATLIAIVVAVVACVVAVQVWRRHFDTCCCQLFLVRLNDLRSHTETDAHTHAQRCKQVRQQQQQ